MKTLKFIVPTVFFSLLIIGCSGDDDTPPAPVNEEEVITSVLVNLVAEGDVVTLESRDPDGDGPTDPEVRVSGNLIAGTTYVGTVQFLNETVSPAEDITEEVEAEGEEHQVFFVFGDGIQGTIDYGNVDGNGNPIGTQFTLVPENPGTGTFTVVLRHEPKKPNNGTLADAAGETDASVTFNVTIE
jgi:hypothetical protein